MLDPKLPAQCGPSEDSFTLDADVVITEENYKKQYQALAFVAKQIDIGEAAQSAVNEEKLAEIRRRSQDHGILSIRCLLRVHRGSQGMSWLVIGQSLIS